MPKMDPKMEILKKYIFQKILKMTQKVEFCFKNFPNWPKNGQNGPENVIFWKSFFRKLSENHSKSWIFLPKCPIGPKIFFFEKNIFSKFFWKWLKKFKISLQKLFQKCPKWTQKWDFWKNVFSKKIWKWLKKLNLL